jgi:hypothetical protein
MAHLQDSRGPEKAEAGLRAEATQPLQTEAIMLTTVGSFGSL